MVIQLMRYGADPTQADGEGYRALHLAVLFQHMPIAAYLMAKGQVRETQSRCCSSVTQTILLRELYERLAIKHVSLIVLL